MAEFRIPRKGEKVRCRLSCGVLLTMGECYEVLEVIQNPSIGVNLRIMTDTGKLCLCHSSWFDPIAIHSMPVTATGAEEYEEIMQIQELTHGI